MRRRPAPVEIWGIYFDGVRQISPTNLRKVKVQIVSEAMLHAERMMQAIAMGHLIEVLMGYVNKWMIDYFHALSDTAEIFQEAKKCFGIYKTLAAIPYKQ